ncbi:MAG: hypothetical protein MR519_08520 [Spirochaetaceae bacterium]|nr:hypothetical protein [Spirochaetaceae bacterium]
MDAPRVETVLGKMALGGIADGEQGSSCGPSTCATLLILSLAFSQGTITSGALAALSGLVTSALLTGSALNFRILVR